MVWEQLEGELHLWLLLTDMTLDVYIHLSGQGTQTLQQGLGAGGSKTRGNDGINEGVLLIMTGKEDRNFNDSVVYHRDCVNFSWLTFISRTNSIKLYMEEEIKERNSKVKLRSPYIT